MNTVAATLKSLAGGSLVLALAACAGPGEEAVAEPSLASPAPVATSAPVESPASSPAASPEFPALPVRDAVPLELGDVQGYYGYDGSDSEELRLQSDVLALWERWVVGSEVQRCMRAAGYDWALETDEYLMMDAEVVDVLQHFGRNVTVSNDVYIPKLWSQENDGRLEKLGEPRANQALHTLYGDLGEYYEYAVSSLSDTLGDPDESARRSVEILLTLPRSTGQDRGLLPYAGGCLGGARDAMPEFTVIPDEVSEAFAATFDVDPELPIMVQSRKAFDTCIRDIGIDFLVDPDQMEAIEELDEEVVVAAYTDCQSPYLDIEGALKGRARDQFVRENEDFLRLRKDAYDAVYEELEEIPQFMAYIDDLEQRALNAS